MRKRSTIKIISVVAVLATVAAVLFAISRTSVGESVKRESAQLFQREYIPNQHVDIAKCAATASADSIYKDFRKKYRFHYQHIGLASFADSSRMILLADIPPHFELDSIAPIFAQFSHQTAIRKHTIGYDGYVTDVLILLANATQENCDRLIKRLSKELFFSDYKPQVTPLPVAEKRRYFAKENIDYQISLNEFNTWFLEDEEGFIQLDDTNNVMSVRDLFASQSRGVYFSRQPGFVAWALAKNEDIVGQVKDIRQFTLDADLILGALADSATLVIIGRERQSPLNELPPLQVESILLLASTTEKELSQSLDINDLMAGKMNNGKDWCPTYLSRELENTEFGDLMTLTDVLLKDWSERGTIQEAYYRYPEPGYYPFDKPLFRKLGLNELVYNWNTAGAMYAIDSRYEGADGSQADVTLYTLNRTGSLPVSYFNSQERSQSVGYRYESQAYHYFATLGNTDLARVVQYTALYQLFIDNNIRYSGNTYPAFPKNKPFLLYKPSLQLLDTIKHLSDGAVNLLADSLSQRTFRNYQKAKVDEQLRANEQSHNFTYTEENIDAIYQNVRRDTQAGFGRSLSEVRNMLRSLSEEQYGRLARYLSYPRGVTIRDQQSYHTMLQGRRVNRLMREIGKNNLDLLGLDLREVKDYYASHLSHSTGRYMKTPSLIITYNDLLTTGGHNLSSRISRVNSMTNYKRSHGSYTPTDYPQPSTAEPSAPSTSTPTTAPTPSKTPATTPSAKTPSAKTPSSKQPTAKPAKTRPAAQAPKPSTDRPRSQATKPSSNRSSVRPRSSVISSAPRKTRGL